MLKLMVENRIGCLLVVDEEKLVGIFSERDALHAARTPIPPKHAAEPISKFMTPNPEALEAKTRIAFAVQRMDLGGYRHVPIIDKARQSGGDYLGAGHSRLL